MELLFKVSFDHSLDHLWFPGLIIRQRHFNCRESSLIQHLQRFRFADAHSVKMP
jgi:hypothetical protein